MTEKSYELTLDELKALYAKGKLSRRDLLVKNDNGSTILHYLAENKNVLSIFQWLKHFRWITKDDLFIENDNGSTVLHYLANNEDAFSIFACLEDIKWITKDDLFRKNYLGATVLDWLNNENKNKVLALFDDDEETKMTKRLYELTLEELKALYAKGKLSRRDLLRTIVCGTKVLHWFGNYNKNLLSNFQWLKDLKWITKDDLFIKNDLGSTVLHYLANNEDALSTFQWLKDLKWITKDDLLVTDDYGSTVLHRLGDNKNALFIFQWLKDLKWITKDDLFIENNLGNTVLHWVTDNENALAILQGLKDLEWITKDDLFRKNHRRDTVLDYSKGEDRNKVLALFDDEETACKAETKPITKDNNIIKGNFVQKTTDKSFFDLEIDFLLKNLNIVDSDLEGDSQVYLSAQDIKETEKVTLEFHRINETIINLKILRNLKNEEKLFEQNYEIDKNTFKKIIKINI